MTRKKNRAKEAMDAEIADMENTMAEPWFRQLVKEAEDEAARGSRSRGH